MKIIRSYAVILGPQERNTAIAMAEGLEDGLSHSAYIEAIEEMLFDAFILGTEEPKKAGDS